MRIAICDDNKDELMHISSILDSYIHERNIYIFYKIFNNATELLATTKYGEYDLYILDIIMPQLNGIDTAKKIRSFDKVAKIAFLTFSPEFAIESYSVKACNYMLKPIAKEKLFFALDDIMETYNRENEASMVVKSNGCIERILLSKLTYVEAFSRGVIYYLASGKVVECVSTFSKTCDRLLPHSEFVQPHRSYVVNMSYINTIKNTEIHLQTGQSIPLSKRRISEIKKRYLSFQMDDE